MLSGWAHGVKPLAALLDLVETDAWLADGLLSLGSRALADGAPTIENGTIRASTRPGLGLTPRPEAWGEAFLDTAALREGKAIAAAVG